MSDKYLAGEEYDDEAARKESQALATKICQDMCIFAIFLTAFTITVMASQSSESSLLVERANEIIELRNSTVPLKAVKSVDSFWHYTQGFFDEVFMNKTDARLARLRSNKLIPLDMANRLLGTVRVRQSRIAEKSGCQIGTMFSEYQTTCYPAYTGSGDTTPYGADPEDQFTFTDADALETDAITGKLASYEPGGFIMPVPANKTKADTVIQKYWNNKFLDEQTRMVVFQFTIWNANNDQFVVCQTLFEFPPVGPVQTSKRVLVMTQRLVTMMGSASTGETIANVMDIFVVMFLLYYVAEEMSEMSLERWGYLEDFWNILDWINMGLLLTAYMMRMSAYMVISDIGELGAKELGTDDLAYSNLQGAAAKINTSRLMNAVNAILLWSKCIKYIGDFPYIQFLFHTIKDSMAYFLWFLILFLIVHFGFVIAFVVAFGEVIFELTNVAAAWIYTIRSVMSDIDVLPIYEWDPLTGALLILLFYIVLILVGINVFFAIMAATLMENTYGAKRPPSDKERAILIMLELVRDRISAFCNCQKRIKALSPGLYKRLYENKKKKKGDEDTATTTKDSTTKKSQKRRTSGTDSSADRERMMGGMGELRSFTPQDVMRAVENMAGKLLSKIHACGIEIRIEVLRVQESLSQMVAVAEALSTRIDKIQHSQEKFMKDFAG